MAEPQTNPPFVRAKSGQVREALDRLEGLVVDGLKHGFFDYSIACEIAIRPSAGARKTASRTISRPSAPRKLPTCSSP
jgi:hypothetical protein